jgi:hypothetical protein
MEINPVLHKRGKPQLVPYNIKRGEAFAHVLVHSTYYFTVGDLHFNIVQHLGWLGPDIMIKRPRWVAVEAQSGKSLAQPARGQVVAYQAAVKTLRERWEHCKDWELIREIARAALKEKGPCIGTFPKGSREFDLTEVKEPELIALDFTRKINWHVIPPTLEEVLV